MKRKGIINRVNKGLRVWLFEGGTLAQQTDFTCVPEGRKTVSELSQLLKALGRKSFLEEQYFLPALALQAPYVLSLMEEENRLVKEHYLRLAKSLDNYLQPGTDGHYRATGLYIQQTYMEFLSHILIYMNRQESLFSGLDRQEDKTGSTDLINLEENHAMEFTRWMLKGMNSREISEWMESDSEGSYSWKKKVLMSLNPEWLQAAGINIGSMRTLAAA
jgi:hypothetical protein